MIELLAALPPKLVSAAIFMAAVAFCVVSLEGLRMWLEHRPRPRGTVMLVTVSLGLPLAAMALGGTYLLLREGATFLALGFFLTGTAGTGILGDLLWRFHSGRLAAGREMRRVEAHDL